MEKAVSTKLDNGDVFVATYDVDWAGCDDKAIKGWAASNRVIAFQRGLRKLTLDECQALKGANGHVRIHAATAGHKIESESEKIGKLVAMGIPRNVAELAVRHPEALEQVTNDLVVNDNE